MPYPVTPHLSTGPNGLRGGVSEQTLSEQMLDDFANAETGPAQDRFWDIRDQVLRLEDGQDQKAEERVCRKLLREAFDLSSIPLRPDFDHVRSVVLDLTEELGDASSTIDRIQEVLDEAKASAESSEVTLALVVAALSG